MKRIAILGANGQVGTEVCLLLKLMPGVEVVPICRSETSASYLRRCDLDVRIGRVDDGDTAARLLEKCDAVADFSLPTGSTVEVQRAMRSVIPNLARYAPAGVPLVYLSSITAFGIPDFHHPLREYRISRNSYGACKRYGERLAFRSGRTAGRPVHVLRIGVVHGELQSVTRKLIKDIRNTGDAPVFLPDCESYSVFAFTIAEALVGIAKGAEKPGLFTAVSNPAWSWKDLHEWHAKRAGILPRIVLLPRESEDASPAKRVVKRVIQPLKKTAAQYKDFFGAYLAAIRPELEQAMRATYHGWSAAAQIAAGCAKGQNRPYGCNYSVFPGRRLQSVSDSRATMDHFAVDLRELVRAAGSGKSETKQFDRTRTWSHVPAVTLSEI